MTGTLYDSIGDGYALHRKPDPRIAAVLWGALGDAASLLNVGAGTGSYEPLDRTVVAVDPSLSMLNQRPRGAAKAVQARAESLPFANNSFDATLAVLTIHHWMNKAGGLAECARVARKRVVLLTFDPATEDFWLARDYLPELMILDRAQFPDVGSYENSFGPRARVTISPLPIPRDCADGFLCAYWARPAAYLDPAVRRGISSFARLDTSAGIARLGNDLESGAWHTRYAHLLDADSIDLGYRVVVAELPDENQKTRLNVDALNHGF